MTCIVATRERGSVTIGADSLGASGYDYEIRKDPKVGCVGPYIFGYSGSFRIGQVLLYDFDPPEPAYKTASYLYPFMVTEFVGKLRETLKCAGVMEIKDSVEEMESADFCVGIHGQIFYVQSDLQVGWPSQAYAAIGCGAPYALGAMHLAYKHLGKRGETLLWSGLEAAEAFSAAVRSPFVFESNK